MSRFSAVCAAAIMAFAGAVSPVSAEDLTIGVKAEISAADPHVLFGPNRNIGGQVYEPLFATDNSQNPMPGLVESWSAVEPTLYEFKLREGVLFHDGSTLTAEDVKFSFERALTLDAPRTFKTYLKNVDTVEVVDDLTFQIRTKAPTAILINNLTTFGIVSKASAMNADENAFAAGEVAGTGPYRWVSYTPGDSVVLEGHDDYWGGAPNFDQVTYKFLKNESTRVAALLSGDVQVIDEVPPNLVKRLEDDEAIEVTAATSYMLNYVGLDQHREVSPYVTGLNGEEIPNPFLDVRVRTAMSHLLNRELISERIMDGLSTPAGQFVPEGMVGHVEGLEPVAYDVGRAKELLAEAGYPDGFKLTIHCTNDRYMNDGKVCEAMGQLLSAGGIPTEVQTLPRSVYFKRASSGGVNGEPEFSFYMVGFGAANGVADAALTALVMTYDKAAKTGANNRARYSNADVDRLANEAAAEIDEARRLELLEEATRIAIDEVGVLPIHHLSAVWATRDGLVIEPRTDLFTRAQNVSRPGN
ncbi:MAG: ABC transporter substrate-binding protein [Pseudomonadota bacterium]